MTRKELYNICHDEAVAYANSEQWSKRTGEEKSFLIQGYLDAMMKMRKSEITEKKKEYPKTYEECCKVLNTDDDNIINISVPLHYNHLLISFTQLLICRDAYWKIAGDEMGLGKPWKPDCNSGYFIPSIIYRSGSIQKVEVQYRNAILAFPTEEMRDAFYENFKESIEQCKELL